MSDASLLRARERPALVRYRTLASERLVAILPLLIVAIATGILAAYLLRNTFEQAKGIYKTVRDDYNQTSAPALRSNDFPAFYTGAEAAVSDDRGELYESDSQLRHILITKGFDPDNLPLTSDTGPDDLAWYRYYNPPIYLIALSPLTSLELREAYLVSVGVNLALLGALMIALGFVLRWRQPHTLLLLLALGGFNPVAIGIHHGQPTLLIAILIALGYIALRSGKTVTSGLLLSLTGVKPHVLITLLPLLNARRRLIVPFIAGCVIFLALPFLIYGPGSVLDYVRLLTNRGEGDVNSDAFATAVLSWPGFLRALTGEPQPVLWLAGAASTFVVALIALRRADAALALAIGVIATLLIVPHSHPQDWVIVAPAAAVLLDRRWSPIALTGIACSLLAIYLGANDWQRAQYQMSRASVSVYWVTVAASALLLWLAVVNHLENKKDAASKETASS